LVTRIVGPNDAEDLFENVFLMLFSKLETFRGESQFETWVHRLAVNDALQHLRRQRRRPVRPLDNSIPDPAAPPSRKITDLVERAIAALDVELRIILELKEVSQMPYSQIAKIVGIPEGTVGSRLNRARRELKQHLIALGRESDDELP
jgi:RNA polymerase sigma-70 factor (ECF subfamily)